MRPEFETLFCVYNVRSLTSRLTAPEIVRLGLENPSRWGYVTYGLGAKDTNSGHPICRTSGYVSTVSTPFFLAKAGLSCLVGCFPVFR